MKKFSFHLFRKLPEREKKITFSTMLTLARFALIPFIVVSMILHHWYAAFIFFTAAAVTDILDGWFARWFNERTFLGAALDPIADKALVIAVFATLAFYQSPLFAIPHWFVALVLIKELIQVAGAIILYRIKGHLTIAPTLLGKLTMFAQSAFITWLFSCYFFHWIPIKTYFVMLATVSILVLLTFVDYVRIGYRSLFVSCMMFCIITFGADDFVIKPSQKKQPKITAEDCCRVMLDGQKITARHMQYVGEINSIELAWAEDFFNGEANALFKKATGQQLQEYAAYKEKSNCARAAYEKVLREEYDFLKQFEKDVFGLKTKNKK